MLRAAIIFVVGASLLVVAMASASSLKVDGGVNQVFDLPANMQLPPPPTGNAPVVNASNPLLARQDGGASGGSAAASTPEPAPVPPAAPAGLSATADGSTVKLAWSPVEGAAYYNVFRRDDNGSGYADIGSALTPAFTDTGVKPGATYYYVVTAVGPTAAESGRSNEATATPLPAQNTDKPGRRTTPVPGPVGVSVPAN